MDPGERRRGFVETGDGRWCVVHLTWGIESDPRWPDDTE